MTKIPGARK